MSKYESILDTIGNTPLVRLRKLAPEGVSVYVKIEAFNPMGSVKDRMARAVIEDAERSGRLRPGQTVIEATSGNTGIGLAMVCASKGYPLVVTMAENFSIERRRLLRFLGARVVLTPASEKGTGMLRKAEELAAAHGWFLCRQFENEANAAVHTATTAKEILREFAAGELHYWVSGFGTGGTLKGVARGLKAADPSIQVIAVEPDNSPVLGSGIAQPRDAEGRPSASHPHFRPHLMQGWSPDFIADLTAAAVDAGHVDGIEQVSGREALALARALAREEGIFAGISGGATLAGALQVARRAPPGSNIVCMLPDTGERYLSTPLFEDIDADMNAEELALSASTPGCRFEAPRVVEPEVRRLPTVTETDAVATAAVEQLLQRHEIVMFALEWCEYCWAVRRLFQALDVDYHSVDLDSVPYQKDDLGGRIRPVLTQRTGEVTIPQIFIGGEFIGGCNELFEACDDGRLQAWLALRGIRHGDIAAVDTRALLPQWQHPRRSA